MQLLIAVLRGQPDLAAGLQRYLGALLTARDHSFLYAESGILANTGFFSELRHRLGNRVLPPVLDPRFLRDLLDEVFDEDDDATWLAHITPELWQALLDVLACADSTLHHIRLELGEALRILACRLAALGLEPDMVRYYPALVEYGSPFLAQQREMEQVIADLQQRNGDAQAVAIDSAHADVLLDQCRDVLARIRRQSRDAGAAVKLTWHLTRAEQIIERMHTMLGLLKPAEATPRVTAAMQFLIELVRAEARRNSVRDLVSGVTDLLSMQVTEHASKTGEHYVARDRSEFFAMFRKAAGAGVIVAFMAIIKMFITSLHLPPLWEALGYSLNYGLGFVLVHVLGFTIATKQPAMTAATLAAALDPRKGSAGALDELVETIAQVSRTQIIAIAGNVLLALIVSCAIAFAWPLVFGAPLIGTEKAGHLLHDLHPLLSLAIPHAAIAGVCLFLSGLISGYYDNKAIYNRVPDRLRRVKWLRRLLGERRLDGLAVYIEHNLGALAGNLSFGFMLGCMGTIGFLLGLPLDIRHVTFGAANLAYGSQALGFQVYWVDALAVSAGVLLIGLTNLAVSFSLALRVALKSRRVHLAGVRALPGMVLRRFWQRPRDFFWPPAE
ncbi:site-specific recombinase [Viridibacterium curvum]|uniref:Site-specific recombinase n=2 Tax=Viridibacterium curvum TaxID=1101404 RepID=A0ABP9R582_9RHOO